MSTFLRDRRLSRALSAEQLAGQLGVHPTSVLRWERRERLPGPGHIHGLARSLAVDPAAVARFFDEARTDAPDPSPGVRAPGLRRLRSAARLPASRVAEAVGVEPAHVYRWEAGRTRLPLRHLPTLAELLAVEAAELRTLLSTPAPPPAVVDRPLRRLRRRTGLSQEAVARQVGASRHSVGAWERGQVPPLGVVRRLSRVYGVPVATVARAAGVTPPPLLDPRRWTPGDLPEALRTLRAWSGRTQAELAARVGCSADAVRGWERGRGVPSAVLRTRLEEAYGLPAGALLRACPRTPTPGSPGRSHPA
ncbi:MULTISPECIES: helix-turn-helix transcriptional regulator [Nocardioides]|uniref:DNA-binding transcriptional regulator, XRE-family HTH domain n=1 Tax=Nocardioides lianchengensis TaxID=1045774 RepID=A0A1G6QAM6_9ACTN|nr:helix-turn-helix transcriptional regulator [Nocardioides lianchengensis]NYG12154.1 transcriptional regulator with XRE-family HTH domain [Nocardioides lianchengensis]SDC89358.1 DNA-binding transcriptional regulator, XRE-family HTH domain [Nocardioides lianchengensis]